MSETGTAGSPGSPVLTYAGRRGRMSTTRRAEVEQRLAALALPAGPVDPAALFGAGVPVVLEIGCGYGAAALGYLAAHPGHGVIAVDVHLPGLARLADRVEEASVAGLRVHYGDAVLLLERLVPARLAAIHVFFPDPWPKSRHSKRRLLSAQRLGRLVELLDAGGVVRVATDRADYAQFVRAQVRELPGLEVQVTSRPAWRPEAGFEAKGVAAGRPPIDLAIRPVRPSR